NPSGATRFFETFSVPGGINYRYVDGNKNGVAVPGTDTYQRVYTGQYFGADDYIFLGLWQASEVMKKTGYEPSAWQATKVYHQGMLRTGDDLKPYKMWYDKAPIVMQAPYQLDPTSLVFIAVDPFNNPGASKEVTISFKSGNTDIQRTI